MTTKDCCKDDKTNLVKATELPIHGNPYPAKDKIQADEAGILAFKIANMRQSMQPILTPMSSFTERVSHIVSTGVAHSQSAWQNVAESNRLKLGTAYGAAFLITITRRGFFRKLFYAGITLPAATAICYPHESREKGEVLWYIVKNKLPAVISEKYNSYFKKDDGEKPQTETASKDSN